MDVEEFAPHMRPAAGLDNPSAGEQLVKPGITVDVDDAAEALYHDLGPDYFDRRAKTVQTRRLVTRLQKLGYAFQITPIAA